MSPEDENDLARLRIGLDRSGKTHRKELRRTD
jgi:hypothetical protein